MPDYRAFGLLEFLRTHPGMVVRPTISHELNIEGEFDFSASSKKYEQITDYYHLRICVPLFFPREIPTVYEIQGRIPRNGSYHVNPDGSLCLGSRLRMLWKLAKTPTLEGFAEKCLVPYLFAVSHKLTHGGDFLFGELAHGSPGELTDYINLLGLETAEQARTALRYLGMKKRKANKLPCICGCGKRLGRCRFNLKLREFRKLAERSWFRSLL